MENKIKTCIELLEIINNQEEFIKKQNGIISRLVNENLEKENIICTLMQKEEYLY